MRKAWHREVRELAQCHTEQGFGLRECGSIAPLHSVDALSLSKACIPAPSQPPHPPRPSQPCSIPGLCSGSPEALFRPHLHHAGHQEHWGCTRASVLRSQELSGVPFSGALRFLSFVFAVPLCLLSLPSFPGWWVQQGLSHILFFIFIFFHTFS